MNWTTDEQGNALAARPYDADTFDPNTSATRANDHRNGLTALAMTEARCGKCRTATDPAAAGARLDDARSRYYFDTARPDYDELYRVLREVDDAAADRDA